MKSFKDTIKKARLAANLSMRQVAEAVGISVVYWSDVERGRRDPFPNEEQISTIASLLDLDFDELSDLAIRDRKVVKFELNRFDSTHSELILRFARLVSDLNNDEVNEIQAILERHKNE